MYDSLIWLIIGWPSCYVGVDITVLSAYTGITARMCKKAVASGRALPAMSISKMLVCMMQSCCLSFTYHNKSVNKEDIRAGSATYRMIR